MSVGGVTATGTLRAAAAFRLGVASWQVGDVFCMCMCVIPVVDAATLRRRRTTNFYVENQSAEAFE